MKKVQNITLQNDRAYAISDHLYGIFLEDIGFAVDGGLNANLIHNYSFDGVYLDLKTNKPLLDPLRYWHLSGGTIKSMEEGGLAGHSRYARITVSADETAVLRNYGYHGGQKGERPAMSIVAGESYTFACWSRRNDFAGNVAVRIVDGEGCALTDSVSFNPGDETDNSVDGTGWKRKSIGLSGTASGYGIFEITFAGEGSIDLDCMEFRNDDYWQAGDPKWRHGKMRKDLVETLRDMKPAFMRFPGGCIVEGMTKGNEYNWKDTVGELWERKSNYNLWSEKLPDGGYNQSYQIGFYEYFCLCEDLGMKPLPTLSAGLNCQIREMQYKLKDLHVPIDSPEFKTYIIDNYLDLIDFAKGDPEKSEWAAVRARMGHPEPFVLDMIGIGNENYGKDYRKRFAAIREAIAKKDPSIRCVCSAGFLPQKIAIRGIWNYMRKKYPKDIVDEHSYHSPEWFEKQTHRYDKYPRGTASVYVGEYSANGMTAGKKMTVENSNCMDSALGEAAFMIGMERNGDVVEMSSFAPLLNLVDSENWFSNLIDFNPKMVCPSVNYYNQKLFCNYYGATAIPFSGKLPSRCYVSVTRDDSKVYLKAVNTGNEAVKLNVSGIPAKESEGCGEMLKNDAPEAKNRLQFTGEAKNEVLPQQICCHVSEGEMELTLHSHSILAVAITV